MVSLCTEEKHHETAEQTLGGRSAVTSEVAQDHDGDYHRGKWPSAEALRERYRDAEVVADYERKRFFKGDYRNPDHFTETYVVRKCLSQAEGPILEIAVGTGRVARKVAPEGKHYVGVDASWPMMHCFREEYGARAQGRGLSKEPIDLMVADAFALPFPDATFGAALAFRFVWHLSLAQREKLYAEVNRVLKPRGIFLFDFRLQRKSKSKRKRKPEHAIPRYTPAQLSAELRANGMRNPMLFSNKFFGHALPGRIRRTRLFAELQARIGYVHLRYAPIFLGACNKGIACVRRRSERRSPGLVGR